MSRKTGSAVQNGVAPKRVIELQMDAEETRITGWPPSSGRTPLLTEPTHAAVGGTRCSSSPTVAEIAPRARSSPGWCWSPRTSADATKLVVADH